MAVNKVIYYNTTLIDLTNTTATADTILQGYGAYGKDGEWIDGTAKSGGGVVVVDELDEHGGTIRHISGTPTQTQTKTVTPTKSTQTVRPDTDYMLTSVTVNPIPSQYIEPTGTKNITTNGTEDVTQYASVSVNVTPSLEAKTNITPTKSSQTIQPSSGYDGLSSVQIDAIPSNYIDTTDATATASDIRSGKSGYVNGVKVSGSLVVNKVYVGSTDPSSSLGNNGDIYIKIV